MIFAALLAAASPSYVSVSPLKGHVLVEECAKSRDMQMDPCVAYIMGASDALSAQRKFCLGGSSYALQVVAVVRKYLRENPERWGDHPLWLVQSPLSKAFPCPR